MAIGPSSSSPSSSTTESSSPSPSSSATELSSPSPSSSATEPSSPSPSSPIYAPPSASLLSPVTNVIAFHHIHRLSSPASVPSSPASVPSSPSFPVTVPSSPSLSITAPPSTSHVIAPSLTSPSSPVIASSSSAVPDFTPSPESAVNFLSLCYTLKGRIGTTRWLRSDMKNPESIADHTYGKSLMALIAPDVPGLDRNKCIKMAIIHDTAEVMILDMTPYLDEEIEHQRELTALYNMCRILGEEEGSRGNEIIELWMEYEANSSLEAKFVKDLDKVEMLLQALDCEGDAQGRDLDEFLRSTAGEFQTEIGKAWATEIVSRREDT